MHTRQDLTAGRSAEQESQGTSPAFKGEDASTVRSVWSVLSFGLVGKEALQRGHWHASLIFQYSPMHPKQKTCPQGRDTGLVNSSRQMQQLGGSDIGSLFVCANTSNLRPVLLCFLHR